MGTKTILVIALILQGGIPVLVAQATSGKDGTIQPAVLRQYTFEVASIREEPPAADSGSWKLAFEGDSFICKGESLRELLAYSFKVDQDRITGGPSWIGTKRFTIRGRVDSQMFARLSALGEDERERAQRSMVLNLLTDRLQLVLKPEKRDLPAYVLEVSDKGPRLTLAPPRTDHAEGMKMLEGPPSEIPQVHLGDGVITANNVPIKSLADVLSWQLGRPVVDQTGLSGIYNFSLTWAAESNAALVAMSRGMIRPETKPSNGGHHSKA